ncbi:MAG: type II toxin-antitoxin system RelB/DinJ family antitoxin [Rhodospirillaceae bacterium]|nr:type II toxin-antitoxin system RelB/DinJ family antitoxin [Rhodospirillaceae bacterium]
MTKTAMVRARMEPGLKKDAERVMDQIGISPTEAIRLFYRQVSLHEGLPFEVRIPNAETRAAMAEVRNNRHKLKSYRSMSALARALRA